MAQRVKMVDLTKSYMPGDPNAFPNNLQFTEKEDDPVKSLPILAYEGYNFLPTSYGYRSYFGTDSSLTLEALPKPCDEIITFQSKEYENMLIAFCSDGIRTAKSNATVWTHSVVLPDDYTNLQAYRQYSWCVIENNLYIYRQGHSHVIKIDDAHVITQFVPSFLNMLGQIGIFRGNGRLCFWDSENSVAWSSAFDLTDFTPSIENMVGNTIFLGVLGRIVNILPHGEGYVVYSTKSIVGVSYNTSGTVVWDAMTITSSGGIGYPKAACIGQNDKEHFAYTTIGIMSIGHFNALSRQYAMEIILPELFDYLKESRDPVYLQCHAARFLYFSLIDDAYINGITSFSGVTVPSMQAPVIVIDSAWMTDLNYGPGDTIFKTLDSFFRDPKGTLHPDYTAASYQVPRWIVSGTNGRNDLTARKRDIIRASEEDQTTPPGSHTVADTSFADFETVTSLYTAVVPLMLNSITQEYIYSIAADNFGPTVTNGQFSINLYPYSDIPYYAENTAKHTCWDILFELLSKYKETSELNELYIASLKSLPTSSSYEYTVVYNAAGSLDLIYEEEEPVIIPKKSSSTRITLDNLSITPRFNVEYADTAGVRLIPSVSRTLKNTQLVSYTNPNLNYWENPIDGMFHVVLQAIISYDQIGNYHYTYWGMNFATDPTVAQINAAFAAHPYYILSQSVRIIEDLSGIYTGISMNLYGKDSRALACESIANPNIRIMSRLYVHKVIDASTEEMSSPWGLLGTDDLVFYLSNVDRTHPYYYLSSPPFNEDQGGNFVMEYQIFLGSYNELLNIVKGFLYTYGNTIYLIAHIHNNKADQIRIDVESLHMVSDTGLAILTHVLKGNATNLTTGAILTDVPLFGIHRWDDQDYVGSQSVLNQVHSFHPDYKVSTIQESVSWTFQDVNIRDFGRVESFGRFTFSQIGVDTYTKQVDNSYLLTGTTEPVVVDLTKNNDGSFYVETNPTIPLYPIEDTQTINPYSGYGDMQIRRKTGPTTYEYANVANIFDNNQGKLNQYVMRLGAIPGITETPSSYDPGVNSLGGVPIPFTYPGATFTLQKGIPAPAYPTLTGSLVFDIQLKKWGKQAGDFTVLLQFSPINETNNQAIDYTNFGMDSGVVAAADKKVKLFTTTPAEGFMRYGKIALYRLGFTELLEVNINFRTPFTGTITVDGSTDDRNLDLGIQHSESFSNVRSCNVKPHVAAMWHTLSISGNFDLQYMEFRGIMASRR